jgi:hypothetical protein
MEAVNMVPGLRSIGSLILATGLILGVACSDDDSDDTQGAEAQVCNDLAALDTALAQLRSLSASSTVNDAQSALASVKDAVDDIRSSARESAEAQVNDLEDAYEDLETAVRNVSSDQSLSQAATSLQADVANVAVAEANLKRSSNCP